MTNCSKCLVQSPKGMGYFLCGLKSIVSKLFKKSQVFLMKFSCVWSCTFVTDVPFQCLENMPLFLAYSAFFIMISDEAQTQHFKPWINVRKSQVPWVVQAQLVYVDTSVEDLFPITVLLATDWGFFMPSHFCSRS